MKTLKLNLIVLLMLTMNFAHSQEKAKAQMKQMQTEKAAYACPMKCEGEKTYDKAGSCPKCKMDLKKVDMKMAEMYACPMKCEGEKTYDKTGSCPKCKMDLKKVSDTKNASCCAGKKMDSTKMECKMDGDKMAEMYACPMKCEGEKTYDKTGSCPKCKMDLKKKEMKKEK